MLSILLVGASAWACSMEGPIDHIVVENPADVQAPDEPAFSGFEVSRGRGPVHENGQTMTTSCDDIGWMSLALASTDDLSSPDHIGYILTLVEGGTLPEGLSLSTHGMEAVRLDADGSLLLTWGDGATDDQEPFSFEVDVSAVDEAGNESAPTRIAVEDDGIPDASVEDGVACNTGSGAGMWALVLGFAALCRRQRWTA